MQRLVRGLAAATAILTVGHVVLAGQEVYLPADEMPMLSAPRMSTAPRIDGVIDPVEWREAAAVSGVGYHKDDMLHPRPTTFYLAWDDDHIYFAARTYLRANYKPSIGSGRSQGMAYVFDDGLELHWLPLGQNVTESFKGTSYKWFLNCIGFIGDLSRIAYGQQIKNWDPEFVVKTRVTEPGTAPEGGSWWELELSSIPRDFDLKGPFRAGDKWRMMFGINHIPHWDQSRIPCNGGYLDATGYVPVTLVENTPAVQMTMNSLQNLATDGTASLKISAFNPTTAPVMLDLDVNVADAIRKNGVITVPAGQSAEFELNEKLPEAVKTGMLDVHVRKGGADLFRYRIPFTTGYWSLAMDPVPVPDPNKFDVEIAFNPVRMWLLVRGDTYHLGDPSSASALRYRVTAQDGGGTVAEGSIKKVADFFLQDVIELPLLKPGKYDVEASLELVDGKMLDPVKRTFEKKDEALAFPRWWGKKVGDIERVLPPFTALRATDVPVSGDGAKGGAEAGRHAPDTCSGFSLLNREYAFNALGLPLAMKSAGAAVLGAPARLVVTVEGRETVIAVGAPRITEQTDWRVRFEGTANGVGLAFTASGWLEQDGLVYVDLTYRPVGGNAVQVDAMRIEFPLAGADADCLYCVGPGGNFSSRTTALLPSDKSGLLWSTLNTGITGSGMSAGSFYPTVWVGSERRGFLWWGDNDKGWVQDDAVAAHEVVRDSATSSVVVLRNNIIARPVELAGPRTISFSYIATPFKPMPKGFRMALGSENGTFWIPFRGVRKDSKTGESLRPVGAAHANWIHPESRYPEEWNDLWREQAQQADAVARKVQWTDPYRARAGVEFTHMSFQLIGYGPKSMEKDVYDYFGPEWLGSDDTWNETLTDYAMTLFEPAFKIGGVRSVYWDITMPYLYGDLLGGLAYRLPNGRVQRGYNGWNVRRFMMRLWALMTDAGLVPGANEFHSTNSYMPIAMPWCDAVLDAEIGFALPANLDWVDSYPISRMRAMSVAHSWGVQISWMSIINGKKHGDRVEFARSQAQWAWMHDSWRNPWITVDNSPVGLDVMPGTVLDWGLNSGETSYHPYWRNPYAACDDKDILVSLWRIPGEQRTMLAIFNYSGSDGHDCEVKVDLAGLGMEKKRAVARTLLATDGTTAQLASGGVIRVKGLKRHRMIIVGLGDQLSSELRRAAKALPKWVAGGLPDAVGDFGLARAETRHFAPGKTAGVACSNTVVQVGMWQLPDRVMLTVYNSDSKSPVDARIAVDLDKLGLVPTLQWQEFVRVRQLYAEAGAPEPELDFHGRTLTVRGLPAGGGRLIAIRRY